MKLKISCLTALILILAGCQQQSESFFSGFERLDINSKLQIIEEEIKSISHSTNEFIITQQQYENFQEKIDVLNYNQNNLNIIKTRETLNQLQSEAKTLKINDNKEKEANTNLTLALEGYEILLEKAEVALITSYDLDRMYYNIQNLSKQLYELSFSGKPTTKEYRESINDLMLLYTNEFEYMQVEQLQMLIKATPIDNNKLESYISNANLFSESLIKVKTYNDIDLQTNGLIIEINQEIINMLTYILEHKEAIEWMNGYLDFMEFYNQQNQGIQKHIQLLSEVTNK